MERILIAMAAPRAEAALAAVRSAVEGAFAPARLSFALSLTEAAAEQEQSALRRLGSCQLLSPAADPWLDVLDMWQGEPYVLIACPEMRFARSWDLGLLRELRACPPAGNAPAGVLTGYLPRPVDPVAAVCPVAAESFDGEGRLCFHRGTPLRYARTSPPSAFLHPRFCFGPAAFFRQVAHSAGPRFLAAFEQRWALYTLRLPLCSLTGDEPLPPCPVEGEARSLRRFGQRFGLDPAARRLSPGIRLGLPGKEWTFPIRPSLAVKGQQALRRALCARGRARPMCATAYVELPTPAPNLPEEYRVWFGYLQGVKGFPLTCFADAEKLRQLQYPNTLTYKRRYALPLEVSLRPEEALNYLRLSRPFLLRQTRERYPSQSHYIWIDFGYQRYPLYGGTAIHWDAVCLDTVCLARVGDALDTSMIVVPAPLLDEVCREMLARCEEALAQTGALPWEAQVWADMAQDSPSRFTVVDLPGPRELLSLTMLSREEEFHAFA